MSNLSFIKSSSAYIFSSSLPMLANLFLLPVYSNYLNTEDFGVISMIILLQSFFNPLMNLQSHQAYNVYFYDETIDNKELFSTLFWFSLGFSALVFGVFFSSSGLLSSLFANTLKFIDATELILLSLGLATIGCPNTCLLSFLKIRNEAKIISIVNLLSFLALTTVTLLLLMKGYTFRALIYGQLSSLTFSACTLLYFNRNYLNLSFKPDLLKKSLHFSFPLVFNGLGKMLFTFSDRFILEKFLPMSQVGLYSFADRLASPFKNIAHQFQSAFMPLFMKQKANTEDPEQMKLLIFKTHLFTCFAALTAMLFLKDILYFFFDDQYFEAWLIAPLLILSYLLKNLFGFSAVSLIQKKKSLFLSFLNFTTGGLNIIANIILIPIYGIYGAVYSTLFGFIINLCASQAHPENDINVINLKNAIPLMVFFICYYLLTLTNPNYNQTYLEWAIKLLFTLIVGQQVWIRLKKA